MFCLKFYGCVTFREKKHRLRVVGDRELIKVFGPKRDKEKYLKIFIKCGPVKIMPYEGIFR